MKNLGQVTENQDIARKQDIPTNTNQLTNGAGFITNSALSGYVPTSRKVNGKALSSDISLTASDVDALPSSTTIPTALSQLSADDTHRTVTDTEKATWNSKSNFSGSYTDLTNKPTIPTVNNGTLTIQKNGTKVQTFTANQSTNVTANITVPTKTSDLTNDSGFITSADLPSGGVTSVVGQTGAITATQIKSGLLNDYGGFAIGTNASASNGGAIGNKASANSGGAIGLMTETDDGGSVGNYAVSTLGGAVGNNAKTTSGGAIGYNAESNTGFAGGENAKATATGSVQLGEGTNATTNTLQFRGYQLLNASGKIPSERLNITIPTKTSDLTNDSGFITSAPVTSVAGNTGAVTASQLVSAILTGNASYGDKITAKDFTTSGKNYIKYQSGLIIQWGNITLSSTTTTITFGTPFQSTTYSIVASKFTGTMSNALYWHAYKFVTQSTTNITIQKGFSESGEKIFWIAIGK